MGRQVYLLATATKKAAAVAERPWKEETEKEQQQQRWEENKNRSDKFVDLSKAKADQEMQASRKKNKTKLVFESGKERDSRQRQSVCTRMWSGQTVIMFQAHDWNWNTASSVLKKSLEKKNRKNF